MEEENHQRKASPDPSPFVGSGCPPNHPTTHPAIHPSDYPTVEAGCLMPDGSGGVGSI